MSQMAHTIPNGFALPCEHKAEIGCVLTAVPVCCACADQRPIAPAYPVYVDGEGMKMQGRRWARYCWKCRDFYNVTRSEATRPSDDVPQSSSSTDMNNNFIPPRPQHGGRLDPLAQSFPSPEPAVWQFGPWHPSRPEWQHNNNTANTYSPNGPMPIAHRVQSDSHPHVQGEQPLPPPRPQQVYPLGTREDVEQEDYQSPIGLMFQRAYNRFHNAEQMRQEYSATLGMPPHAFRTIDHENQHPANSQFHSGHPQGYVGVGQMLYPGTSIQLGYQAATPHEAFPPPGPYHPNRRPRAVETVTAFDERNAVDRQENRPKPRTTEDMTVSIACKMCMEQPIDTLIEPCMHVAMCRWCSDVWQANARNVRARDPSTRQPWKCPVCRKGIQQVRRVYF